MEKETATFTSQEIHDLVLSILDGVDAIEDGDQPRDSWSDEMRDWCLKLLERITTTEGGASH